MKKPILAAPRSAFSLIELVVVIAIIAIIATFTVPAATTILRGSAMTQASQMLTDQISLARQMALSRNRAIEVRFYVYADPEAPGEDPKATLNTADPTGGGKAQFRGLQLFEIVESGVAVPLDKPQRFPVTVVMNAGPLSTLIAAATQKPYKVWTSKDPELPRGVSKNYLYTSFRFQQDGSTNLTATGSWYLTIHNLTDKLATPTTPPPNFFTIQIDPVSGSTKGFRPTAG